MAYEHEEMKDNTEYNYTDDDEEERSAAEIALENAYYNAKALRDDSMKEAIDAFESVVEQENVELMEGDGKAKEFCGLWSFKAIKQLVKLHLKSCNYEQMMKQYHRLLELIPSSNLSPKAVEKSITGLLDRVLQLYQGCSGSVAAATIDMCDDGDNDNEDKYVDPQVVAGKTFDLTLKTFHPKSGSSPNERLWFKTSLKYGQLLYESNETSKLKLVLNDLESKKEQCDPKMLMRMKRLVRYCPT